jgi:hypothetical protein
VPKWNGYGAWVVWKYLNSGSGPARALKMLFHISPRETNHDTGSSLRQGDIKNARVLP